MAAQPRIDQLLSRCGYCSRSEARRWIRAGRVTVNGVAVGAADARVDPATVRVDGEWLDHPERLVILLHKPPGCVCSHEAGEGRTIYDLLPERWRRRHPALTSIGRLDKDTTGALVVTDDGDLVHRWTSPRHEVTKCYEVSVDGGIPEELVEVFGRGDLVLEGETRPCLPARLELVGPREARLYLVEGRYHQVKRMFASQGLHVVRLHRSRFGAFGVDDLAVGEWRVLSRDAVEAG